jgi:outer membrane protein, heavy metal efflux system
LIKIFFYPALFTKRFLKFAIGGSVLSSAFLYANVVQAAEAKALSVEQTLTQLEQSNRLIQNSKRLTEAAKAEVRKADVGPNPNVSFGAFNSIAKRYRYAELDQTLRIEQTFERGNKRALRVSAAQEIVKATEADINDVTRQQKIVAAGAYVDLMLAQRVLLLSQENVLNFKRLLEGASKRLKAGDIASADVSRLSVEQSRASNEVRASENNLLQAQFKLASLLAMEGTVLTATDNLPELPFIAQQTALLTPEAKEIAVEKTLNNRSDLLAAPLRSQAAPDHQRHHYWRTNGACTFVWR